MIMIYVKGRVSAIVDSALLSLLIYLLKTYTKRDANRPSKWSSVEESNKKILSSALKILEYTKNNE